MDPPSLGTIISFYYSIEIRGSGLARETGRLLITFESLAISVVRSEEWWCSKVVFKSLVTSH